MSDTKLAALDRGLRPQRRREIVDRPARDLVLQEFVIEARVVAKHRPDQERVRRVRVGAKFRGLLGPRIRDDLARARGLAFDDRAVAGAAERRGEDAVGAAIAADVLREVSEQRERGTDGDLERGEITASRLRSIAIAASISAGVRHVGRAGSATAG